MEQTISSNPMQYAVIHSGGEIRTDSKQSAIDTAETISRMTDERVGVYALIAVASCGIRPA